MLRNGYSRLSLRTKATGIALAISMLSLLVVATTGAFQIRGLIVADQHRSADATARGISRASERAMSNGDTKELSRIASTFLRDENTLFIAAYGDGDKLLASAVRDTAAWVAFQAGHLDFESCVVGRYAVELPFGGGGPRKAGEPIGRIVVG